MPAGVTEDIVGNPTTAASYTYQYQPLSGHYETATAVSNAVFGGLTGVTVAAAIGVTGVGGAPLLRALHMGRTRLRLLLALRSPSTGCGGAAGSRRRRAWAAALLASCC